MTAEAFEAAEARLALGIDLAAIERLALVVVAEDLIGGVELGEPHRRLGVVLVGVGMQLLGEPPIGLLDIALALPSEAPPGPRRGRAFVKTPLLTRGRRPPRGQAGQPPLAGQHTPGADDLSPKPPVPVGEAIAPAVNVV